MGSLTIKLDNVSAYVQPPSQVCTNYWESVRWLSDYLTWESVAYPGGKKTKIKKSLFEAWNRTFPAGLVWNVKKAAERDGIAIDVIRPQGAITPDFFAGTEWLRDYQQKALTAALKYRRGVLWLPTGAGKTEIATALMKSVPNARWLFLVHRANLVKQSAERFEKRTGEEAGMLGGGQNRIRRVTFATFQTLAQAFKNERKPSKKYAKIRALVVEAGGIIVDECHVLPARSFLNLTRQAINAEFRIGLSATPFARGSQDSLHLMGATGPTIFRLKVEELANRNAIIKPTIRLVEVEQGIPTPQTANPRKAYSKVYEMGIEQSEKRNQKIVDLVWDSEKPCVVFVKGLDHLKTMVEKLSEREIPCAGISGSTPHGEREETIRLLQKGELECLVATVVLQEGVDIPDLRCVIVASGGRSTIAAIQRAGRAMRTAEGKDQAVIIDIWDTGNKILERHAKKRKKAYEKEGFNVKSIEREGQTLGT